MFAASWVHAHQSARRSASRPRPASVWKPLVATPHRKRLGNGALSGTAAPAEETVSPAASASAAATASAAAAGGGTGAGLPPGAGGARRPAGRGDGERGSGGGAHGRGPTPGAG